MPRARARLCTRVAPGGRTSRRQTPPPTPPTTPTRARAPQPGLSARVHERARTTPLQRRRRHQRRRRRTRHISTRPSPPPSPHNDQKPKTGRDGRRPPALRLARLLRAPLAAAERVPRPRVVLALEMRARTTRREFCSFALFFPLAARVRRRRRRISFPSHAGTLSNKQQTKQNSTRSVSTSSGSAASPSFTRRSGGGRRPRRARRDLSSSPTAFGGSNNERTNER